jgi:uncharacterized membrane protein YbhN (UPF0104 family)
MSRAILHRVLAALLLVVATVVVVASGSVHAYVLPMAETLGRLRPTAILAVFALTGLSAILSGLMWSKLLSRMGHNLPLSTGISAFAGTGLASYIGNAAGSTVGGVVYLRRRGVQPGKAAIVVLMANALGLCGVLVWAPIGLILVAQPNMRDALPLLGSHDLAAVTWAFAGLGVCMLLSLWLLVSADRTAGALARRFCGKMVCSARAEAASDGTRLRLGCILRLVPWAAAAWLAGTMVLYALLAGLEPTIDVNLINVLGASAVAAAIGSLAFFVPSGVGVRDGALIVLLSRSTGVPTASCAAAVLALRVLDPLSKLGIMLVVATGAFDGFAEYSTACWDSLVWRLQLELEIVTAFMAQRGLGRQPVPVPEAVRDELEWET